VPLRAGLALLKSACLLGFSLKSLHFPDFILFLMEILGCVGVSAFQLNWGQVLPNYNSPGGTGKLYLQLASIINLVNASQAEVPQL